MAKNKIVYGGEVLIDLTGDTLTKENALNGFTFHDKTGEIVTGECTFDVDSTDATGTVSELLEGKSAYARGSKLIGTMPNNGAVNGTISTKGGQYTVPQGFHDGSGKVGISTTEQNKIVASNIKSGVTILGVTGNYTGASVTAQTKTVVPTKNGFSVHPDANYDYLAEVIVDAIPYVESSNSAGGTTVTIG